MSKKSAFAIAKILNCEGNSSDDKILRFTENAVVEPGVRLGGGGGGPPPLPHLADPPTSGQNSTPGGVEFQPPHLSFAEVGMLLDSHFLLMQFLKYLGLHHDDLNVTTS